MAEQKYVVFRLDKEFYGMPIESVERILPDQKVTKLPRTPKMFLGVFELRGATIPVIDARMRFEMNEGADAKNLIVVLTEQGRCAIRVDSVDGIMNLSEADIDENPQIVDQRGDDSVRGIGKSEDKLTVLLDPDRIVPKQLRTQVAKANAA